MTSDKPRLAIVSMVLPFPGHTGQQQRVRYKLQALRKKFHLMFITAVPSANIPIIKKKLQAFCDEAIIFPARYALTPWHRWWHRGCGLIYTGYTGLKFSNYVTGQIELSPQRIKPLLRQRSFVGVLFEYWHAVDSVLPFQAIDIPCVLDMHNILWQSYRRQLQATSWPAQWQARQVRLYQQQEEAAWQRFDGLITINAAEHAYVEAQLPDKPLFYAPMGLEMAQWPYDWEPLRPPRVAYYGGLGSPHNQRDAWHCYHNIMPQIWANIPEAELWLVGSNPPPDLQELGRQQARVHVTGFVPDVQQVLRTMSCVLCPWQGQYGFRSRLIEVMALGVPVVASPDAIYGMELQSGQGIFLEDSDEQMASVATHLLADQSFACIQSQLARQQVEVRYSFSATYDRLAQELAAFIQSSTE